MIYYVLVQTMLQGTNKYDDMSYVCILRMAHVKDGDIFDCSHEDISCSIKTDDSLRHAGTFVRL